LIQAAVTLILILLGSALVMISLWASQQLIETIVGQVDKYDWSAEYDVSPEARKNRMTVGIIGMEIVVIGLVIRWLPLG